MNQKSEKSATPVSATPFSATPVSATPGKDHAHDPAARNSDRPSADTLAAAARAASANGPAPVHLWNPPFCGDLDMRIARDGSWWYQGSPIGRESLVRLFSSILKREGDRYYLVTPAEKVGIQVDDAPFVAVDFTLGPARAVNENTVSEQTDITSFGAQEITFTTQVGDIVTAGPDHPIRVSHNDKTGEPTPYVLVRAGLWALIDRKSFYRLIELGEHCRYEGERWFGLISGGAFFPVTPSTELDDI
jgi:hypothetical protein